MRTFVKNKKNIVNNTNFVCAKLGLINALKVIGDVIYFKFLESNSEVTSVI